MLLLTDSTISYYIKLVKFYHKILFNQTFFIDSFLDFRLVPLKKHWSNLAELSSNNLTVFSTTTLIDVIKFILTTIDREVYKTKIVLNGGVFSLYNMQKENSTIIKIGECNDCQDLISKVFNACPTYIDIYLNSKQQNDAVKFLSNVFTNKLKIYSKDV